MPAKNPIPLKYLYLHDIYPMPLEEGTPWDLPEALKHSNAAFNMGLPVPLTLNCGYHPGARLPSVNEGNHRALPTEIKDNAMKRGCLAHKQRHIDSASKYLYVLLVDGL